MCHVLFNATWMSSSQAVIHDINISTDCQHTVIKSTALSNCFAKHCRDVRLGQLIFHPQCDTLSPSCKSRTSLGTMGSGATELLELLKEGSPFIWGHYNSTKACGCLHTERAEDEWAALTLLTCTDKALDQQRGKPAMCGPHGHTENMDMDKAQPSPEPCEFN